MKKDTQRKGHLELDWEVREDWSDWASLKDGTYLLRTNLTEKTPEELWKTYMQLADAAFRTLKSDV